MLTQEPKIDRRRRGSRACKLRSLRLAINACPQREQQGVGSACTGGHLFVPYEQNTQQSPAFGLSTVLQFSHS